MGEISKGMNLEVGSWEMDEETCVDVGQIPAMFPDVCWAKHSLAEIEGWKSFSSSWCVAL